MDIVIDIILEFFVESVMEWFADIGVRLLPSKNLPSKQKEIIKAVVSILALLIFAGMIVGIVLLIDSNGSSIFGWILTTIAAAYILLAIILNIIKGRAAK